MASGRRAVSVSLTDAEMRVLESMAEQKVMSKTALLRQALRLYQLLETRLVAGGRVYFEDEVKHEKTEIIVA